MIRWMTLLTAALALWLAGCGGPVVTPATPPEIRYGEDVCDQCNMIISDERFAAGLVVEVTPGTFEHRIFDDIGDLLGFEADHGDKLAIASYFVHDYADREWIDGGTAYYVRSATLATPMGFGIAAFADRAEADALARELDGAVLTLDALRAEFDAAASGEQEGSQ